MSGENCWVRVAFTVTMALAFAYCAPTPSGQVAGLSMGMYDMLRNVFPNLISVPLGELLRRRRKVRDWLKNEHLQLLLVRSVATTILSATDKDLGNQRDIQKLAGHVGTLRALPIGEPGGLIAWLKIRMGLPVLPKEVQSIKEHQLTGLVAGGLEAIRSCRPLNSSQWRAALEFMCWEHPELFANFSEPTKQVICATLETEFTTKLFETAGDPDPEIQTAWRKLMLLQSGEILALARKHDPILRGLRTVMAPPTQSPSPAKGLPLHFANDQQPIIGREKEFRRLLEFCTTSPVPVAWTWVSAPHGHGKSRLLLHLHRELAHVDHTHESEWDVLWYAHYLSPSYDDWRGWVRERPTVLIIDDALRYPEVVRSALLQLADQAQGQQHTGEKEPSMPVRLILVDRTPAVTDSDPNNLLSRVPDHDPWSVVWKNLDADVKDRVLSKGFLAPGIDLSTSPLELAALADIVARWAPGVDRQQVEEAVNQLTNGEAMSPAYAVAAGMELSRNSGAPIATLAQVLSGILDHEMDRWRSAGVNDDDLHALTLATLADGLDSTGGVPEGVPVDFANREHMRGWVFSMIGGDSRTYWPPVKPTLMAALYVLRRWNGSLRMVDGDRSDPTIANKTKEIAAWCVARDSLRPKVVNLLHVAEAEYPELSAQCGTASWLLEHVGIDWHWEVARILGEVSRGDSEAVEARLEALSLYAQESDDQDRLAVMRITMAPPSEARTNALLACKEHKDAGLVEVVAGSLVYRSQENFWGHGFEACNELKTLATSDLWREHPGINEAFAVGLANLTDKAELDDCQTAVGELRTLATSDRWREHPVINYIFAAGLTNLTVKAELDECRNAVGKLKKLATSDRWREHPGINGAFAIGLANLTAKAELGECRNAVGKLKKLATSDRWREHPGINEAFARGLANLTAKAELDERRSAVGELRTLATRDRWQRHPGISEAFARCLVRLTFKEELGECRTVMGELRTLATSDWWREHPVINDAFAKGLTSLTVKAELDECRNAVDELRKLATSDLWREHPGINGAFAKGLFNLTRKAELGECRTVVGELRTLATSHLWREHPGINEAFARGLVNLTAEEELGVCRTAVGELRTLATRDRWQRHPGISEAFARCLVRLTFKEELGECRTVMGELRTLATSDWWREHPEINEAFARGLANLTAKAELDERRSAVGELRTLATSDWWREHPGINEASAKGLINLTRKAELAEAIGLVAELCGLRRLGSVISRLPALHTYLIDKHGYGAALQMVVMIENRIKKGDPI